MKKLSSGLAALLMATAAHGPAQADTAILGAYPDKIITFDEAKGEVTQVIDLKSGLPTSLLLSDDEKTLYVTTLTTGGIEVIDTATRKVTNSFSLNTPTTRYRFSRGAVDPTGRFYYAVATQYDKGVDRYSYSKPKYIVIDLKLQKIVRSQEMGEDDLPGRGLYGLSFKVSPDGKWLYLFHKKVIVVDTKTLKSVKTFEISKPAGMGLEDGQFGGGFGGRSRIGNSANEYVSLFTASDPYIHNKIFGIGRFDLNKQELTFTPVAPAPESMPGFQVTPDGKDGYAVITSGKLGNKRCEFWHFDMDAAKLLDKAEFQCRSRFYFSISGNGEKLYIYGAGHEIEAYDAKTLQYDKTWELNHDATMAGLVYVP